MISKDVEFQTPDGTCDAVLYRSAGGERLPGVVYLTDIFGIRASQREKAGTIAESGYAVLMPNIFYRTARPPLFEKAFATSDEHVMQRLGELRASLDAAAMERDAGAYVDYLASCGAASDAPIGVVGYCFSGKMALYAAAARPERVGSAASFHGGGLVTEDASSPHRLLPRIKARLYFGHADHDKSMPAEAIAALEAALAAWGGRYESELYRSATHAWTEPDSPVYDSAQAARAFDKLIELLGGS